MDRRAFLHSLVGGLSMASAVRTWPFRVYSFPSKIVLARFDDPSAELQLENFRTAVPILLLGDDVPPKRAYAADGFFTLAY